MPKGYVILTEAIKDPEGMKAYGRAAGAAMGGVNILAVDTAPEVIEGNWHGHQTVVLEFESVLPAPGTGRRPTRTQPNCAKPPPTATR
jgi:uncharacterized protein (DUF1330 family)